MNAPVVRWWTAVMTLPFNVTREDQDVHVLVSEFGDGTGEVAVRDNPHGTWGPPTALTALHDTDPDAVRTTKVEETARVLMAYEHRMGRSDNGDYDAAPDRARMAYTRAAESALVAAGTIDPITPESLLRKP